VDYEKAEVKEHKWWKAIRRGEEEGITQVVNVTTSNGIEGGNAIKSVT
jgi:hypothetical protein